MNQLLEKLNSELVQLREHVDIQRSQLKESSNTISTLKRQDSKLLSQLRSSEQQVELLQQNVAELRSEIDRLNVDYQEKAALELQNLFLAEKVSVLRTQLKAGRHSFTQASWLSKDAHVSKLSGAHAVLQTLLEEQAKEISLLNEERGQLLSLLQHFSSLFSSFDTFAQQQLDEKEAFEEKVSQWKAADLEPVPSRPEAVPVGAWLLPEFPSDLTRLVTEIAQNGAIPTQSKIRHVLTIVAKYYIQKLAKQEKATKKESDSHHQVNDSFRRLLISLATVLEEGEMISEDSSFAVGPTNRLVLSVARLKEQLRQFQIQNDSLQTFLSNLNVGLIPEAEKAVGELKELIRGLLRQTKQEKGKARQQQKSCDSPLRKAAQKRISLTGRCARSSTKLPLSNKSNKTNNVRMSSKLPV
jgi:hypothetical protein